MELEVKRYIFDDVDVCILTGKKRNHGALGKNESERKLNED